MIIRCYSEPLEALWISTKGNEYLYKGVTAKIYKELKRRLACGWVGRAWQLLKPLEYEKLAA